MKRFGWSLCLGFILIVQGCGINAPPLQGTVSDLVTGQPISGVDVVVLYIGGGKGRDGHYYSRCSANQIKKTDANGHWEVENRRLNMNPKVLTYSILLYKDGYREGSPGREKNTTIEMKLVADEDVYEYDEFYQKKRDYTKIHNQTIEYYKQAYLTPYYYLGSNILGSDNDHQILFYGCAEKGMDDPGLNAFAQKFILRWIDPIPERYKQKNIHGNANACFTIRDYVRAHPEFRPQLFSTEQRSEGLRWNCPDVWSALKSANGGGDVNNRQGQY